MKSSRQLFRHRYHLLLICAGALILASCSRDANSPLGSAGPSPAPTAGFEFVGVIPERGNVDQVIEDNGLVELGWLEDSQTLLFAAPTGFDPADFKASGPNEKTEWTEAGNGLITFFEWENHSEELSNQAAFECMDLELVHQVRTGFRIRVAMLDTGVDDTHWRFDGSVILAPDPVLEPARLDGVKAPEDVAYGHGTHVAGVILNVAPDATILPLKVLGEDGRGDIFDLVAGLDAAIRLRANIINLSLSVSASSPVVAEALDRVHEAGIYVVAAAGNNRPGAAPVFPANYPTVFGVAATEGENCTTIAPFSSWHPTDVAFAAIGTDVHGPGAQTIEDPDSYSEASGTSSACAVVTGCFALMLDRRIVYLDDPIDDLEASALSVTPAGSVLHGLVSPIAALGLR